MAIERYQAILQRVAEEYGVVLVEGEWFTRGVDGYPGEMVTSALRETLRLRIKELGEQTIAIPIPDRLSPERWRP